MVGINFTDVCWLLLTGSLLGEIYLFGRQNRKEKVDGEEEKQKASGKSHSCSLHVWHAPLTLHPAWAAGQLSCERGAAETPFCFSGFPLLFSGAY